MASNIFEKVCIVLIVTCFICRSEVMSQSQFITNEDSFNNNKTSLNSTIISGYGELSYQRDAYLGNANVNLTRAVLFIGHKFNYGISFFSELELENAKVSSEPQNVGEIAFEQLLLKFNLSRNSYLLAGLFLPRIGIMNEDHLPINYFSVERPLVESQLLANTWRELGIGYYLQCSKIPLNFSVALLNGLNSEKFNNTGFKEGRFDGQNAFVNNFALTSSLRYFDGNLRIQISQYLGGTSAMNKRKADSLQLESGPFGSYINIGTIDFIYQKNAFALKGIASYVYIDQAEKINKAFANLTPKFMYGSYFEMAYDLLFHKMNKAKQLFIFSRYERIDYNAVMYKVGGESLRDGSLNQHHLICGLTFFPINNVVIKADIRLIQTGDINLILDPNKSPSALPYQRSNSFLNLAIGYAF